MKIKQIKMNGNGFYAKCFSCCFKEKFVGLVNILQDQYMLGVTGPTVQVIFQLALGPGSSEM